ncbi:unnamed protein product [Cladocopium goreaui]|uniref:Hyaluronan mediated motility receptor n=1 Tax=Cladocopium goreaui TaxID=2562237 RepID=A0A9P1GA80_9DINO|nr:unnamed protein product [Cladocopium goreaui]
MSSVNVVPCVKRVISMGNPRVPPRATPGVRSVLLVRLPKGDQVSSQAPENKTKGHCKKIGASPPVMPHRRAAVGAKVKGNKGDESDLRLAEAEQLCMLQQSALDRISMDFQHLKALIERVVMLADTERRNGAEGGNFAALLHRLREIIAANHRTPCTTRELAPLPVAATSITCDDDDMELAEGEVICYGEQVPELS